MMLIQRAVRVLAIALFAGLLAWSYAFSPGTALASEPDIAEAMISGTQAASTLRGQVQFTETEAGLLIHAQVMDAPPGKHGFHIHENGSCADGGQAAGGHFNPNKVKHGYLPLDGIEEAHAGDLGNIEIDENGVGELMVLAPELTLKDGQYAIQNLAVILHEQADDFGQPTGHAGGRIGCGIISTIE